MKKIEYDGKSLKMSDLLYNEALAQFTTVQGRLAYGFTSLDDVLVYACKTFHKSSALMTGQYRVIMYSSHEGYCGRNAWGKNAVRAVFTILNGRIVAYQFGRQKLAGQQRVDDAVYTDGVVARKTHLARFIGLYQKFWDSDDNPNHNEWEAFVKVCPDFNVRPI